MRELLKALDLASEETIELVQDHTRDDENCKVYRDSKSNVIFTEGQLKQYDQGLDYWGCSNIQDAWFKTRDDDTRRVRQFSKFLRDRNVLDFGCGTGGFMKEAGRIPQLIHGVELNDVIVKELSAHHFSCFKFMEMPDEIYDTVTMFHVLEHLSDPVETLRKIHEKLKYGGMLIVEVPHAQDVLIQLYESVAFKEFTFWSEHLILHTAKSLQTFLEFAGFSNIKVDFFQRYPLSNHLHWLTQNAPGGHRKWDFLNSDELTKYYGEKLQNIGMTDTLVAYAYKDFKEE